MSTSIHVVFNVVSGNEYFVKVISEIHGRKMRFSENSQNCLSEKSIFGHFEVIFLNVFFYQDGGKYFLLVLSKRSILTKR